MTDPTEPPTVHDVLDDYDDHEDGSWATVAVLARKITADPAPLLAALPEAALVAALVARGLLTEHTRVSHCIVTGQGDTLAIHHRQDTPDPRGLQESLRTASHWYPEGARVERVTDRWHQTTGMFSTWEPVDDPQEARSQT